MSDNDNGISKCYLGK